MSELVHHLNVYVLFSLESVTIISLQAVVDVNCLYAVQAGLALKIGTIPDRIFIFCAHARLCVSSRVRGTGLY